MQIRRHFYYQMKKGIRKSLKIPESNNRQKTAENPHYKEHGFTETAR